MEQLIADGVRHIFGNPGTTEQGFMDILQDYPQVEFMLALHEGVAMSMADTYARITRRPAFVEVHIAPGLGNALGMIDPNHDGALKERNHDGSTLQGEFVITDRYPERCPGLLC